MLEPVVRPGENGSAFVPDNLLMVEEPNPQQTIEDLAGELGRIPYVAVPLLRETLRRRKVPSAGPGATSRPAGTRAIPAAAERHSLSRRLQGLTQPSQFTEFSQEIGADRGGKPFALNKTFLEVLVVET